MTIDALISVKTVIVITGLLIIFMAEQRFSAAPRTALASDRFRWGRNLSLWGINTLLSPLIVIPVTAWSASYGFGWRPAEAGWPVSIVDIVLLDFWIYWWHRANHHFSFLWRFHRIHHLDQWLDATSAVRFHFGEVVLSALVRALFILCLGISLQSVIVFEMLVLLMAGVQHSNIRLPVRFETLMSKLLITPSIHWVHHHVLRKDTDSNYGTVFSFWDRLFGSMSPNSRTPDMVIGLDAENDRHIGQLLLAPFNQQRTNYQKGTNQAD